ncbi:GPI-GlcNAc transferase complex, PIG-H component-domain-containing protein [Delphinella strobiligena]|nr:GPI-GlcNAc transferase complex, PIG-H component-domain-containing protein [Delphinella strobiligena]
MLTIKRPTPTTVRYTVSTRSATNTLPSRINRFTIATPLAPSHTNNPLPNPPPPSPPSLVQTHFPGRLADHLATKISWRWILPISLATLWFIFRRGYTEESLLVIRGLGVQTSTSSPTYLSTASTRFIPSCMIQDVFIHEAFKGFEVRFYLTIVVEGEEEVVVVFPSLLPKRRILETVWRGARACLYEPKS